MVCSHLQLSLTRTLDTFRLSMILFLRSIIHLTFFYLANTDGEMAVSHESADREWLYRRSKHRIWLRKVHPFVFCDNYRKRKQIQRHGEFEICFVERKGIYTFPSDPTSYIHIEHIIGFFFRAGSPLCNLSSCFEQLQTLSRTSSVSLQTPTPATILTKVALQEVGIKQDLMIR